MTVLRFEREGTPILIVHPGDAKGLTGRITAFTLTITS